MQKRYKINEIFRSIQGEGYLAGTPCLFIRFAGCNMACPFCDTDHSVKMELTANEIYGRLVELNPKANIYWVVLTGGEPLLQVDTGLLELLGESYEIALETNGTVKLDGELMFEHIACSPKAQPKDLQLSYCHELKVLYPPIEDKNGNPIIPESFDDTTISVDGDCFLQPVQPINQGQVDHKAWQDNIQSTVEKVQELPGWRLSLQIHKMIGLR